jgi:hypothetical protein
MFAGNRHDSTTVREIVTRMEARYGRSSRVWALDRGMVSEDHLAWLRERGSRYIVGTPKNQLRAYERQLIEGEWRAIREGLAVQQVKSADGVETFLLCRSDDRAAKEQAMRERFAERIEAGLTRMAAGCLKRRSAPGTIERRVGRLLQRNQRAARFYEVRVTATEDGAARVQWSRNEATWTQARACDGCYVLRSNVTDWGSEELWRAYIQLTEAEIDQAHDTSSASCCRSGRAGYDSGNRVLGLGQMAGATRQESSRRIRMSDNSRSTIPPRAHRQPRPFRQPATHGSDCRRRVVRNCTGCSVR